MWQLTWMLSFLPDWVWTLLLICGIVAFVAARFFPQFPLKISGIVAIIISVWFLGAASNEAKWEARVKELEAKVAEAQTASTSTTKEVEVKVVEKTKVVREKGKDIIKYIDNEIVKKEEIIKYVESCPVPKDIIDAHNAAAMMNKAVEGEKK